MIITKKVTLHYLPSRTNEPLIQAIQKYNLEISIVRAEISSDKGGYLTLAFTGERRNIREALRYLRNLDVKSLNTAGLDWDGQRCSHCGACVVHCPSGALSFMDLNTRTINFNKNICLECQICIKVCPFGACSLIDNFG